MIFPRVENPPLQKKYQDYKPYLRRDFRARCAYCLIHEAHYGGLRNFHVDHFRPKSIFPDLTLTYVNLYYACGLCNIFKGDVWPSQEQQNAGLAFTDPCLEDPYQTHFLVKHDGSLAPLTVQGRCTQEHLRLNRRQLRRYRRMQIEAREKCDEVRSLKGATLTSRMGVASRAIARSNRARCLGSSTGIR